MKKICIINGSKEYKLRNEKILAMNKVNLEIETGKMYVIMGHSGSGKSTLIQTLGLLDSLTSGKIFINDVDTSRLTEKEKADVRRDEIGFVFQSFYLNPRMNALENVMLPMYINANISKKDRKKKAIELLKEVGLESRIYHFPRELSGGEQQRIAIARALANNPTFILADEPTGNLDSKNEERVYKILKDLSQRGKAVVIVSHNENIKSYADVIFNMCDGKLVKDYENK